MNKKGGFNKSGQITIFIILAVIIVAGGVILYFIFPEATTGFGVSTNNPNLYIQNCMEDEIENNVDIISSQGGSMNPENFILYKDDKIDYLCYTSEFYVSCAMQQPLLKQHIEEEIKESIKDETDSCFNSLVEDFENQGYDVNLVRGKTTAEILPKRVEVTFENDLTLTKENSERYEKIVVTVNKNIYELMSIANSILNMEARYGDSETTIYMNYYHDLKVEKLEQNDGSTIYILTNRDTNEKFQFASRSVAFPPGI
ncbi:hypothetical protein J4407_02950 [Candidatus Pacearchaeota archaeon]|nr:hypothetical protein [Candidatus Pacearchaeota archaeon]